MLCAVDVVANCRLPTVTTSLKSFAVGEHNADFTHVLIVAGIKATRCLLKSNWSDNTAAF